MRVRPIARGEEAGIWAGLAATLVLLYLWQTQAAGEPAPGEKAYGLPLLVPIAGGALALAVFEWRSRLASRFLALSLADGRRSLALLAVLLAAGVKLYFVPGWRLLQGDGLCHVTAAWIAFDAFQRGELPIWSNAWAAGFPFLLFYPPLFSLAAGALALATRDVMVASRLLLAAAHAAAGFGMFLFAGRLTRSRGAALLSAVLFALCPWHVFQSFHWNRFPTALLWGLLPWPFWLYERGRDEGKPWAGAAGLFLALAFLAHHGYATFASVLFATYVAGRSITRASAVGALSLRWRDLGGLVWTGMGAAILSGFSWIPYRMEADETFQLPGLAGGAFFFDQPTIAGLLLPSRHPAGHSGYIGLVLFGLSLVGVLHATCRRREGALPVLGLYLFSYFLVLGHWIPFYDWIPGVRLLFTAGRYLVFFVFFASLAAAFAFEPILAFFRADRERTMLVLLAITLADVAPSTFTVYRFGLPGGRPMEEAYRVLARESTWKEAGAPIPAGRVLTIPAAGPRSFLDAIPIPYLGRYPTTAPGLWGVGRSGPFLFRIWVATAREWETGQGGQGEGLTETTRDLLALAGVAKLVTAGGEIQDLDGAGLAVWARRAEAVGDPETFPREGWEVRPFGVLPRPAGAIRRIPGWMGFDRIRGVAERIGVRGSALPWAGEATVEAGGGDPGFRLLAETVTQKTLGIRVSTRLDGYLRIAESYSPHHRISLDGREVAAAETFDHMIAMRLPAGEHEVTVEAGLSALRKGLAWAAAVWCLQMLAVAERRFRAARATARGRGPTGRASC